MMHPVAVLAIVALSLVAALYLFLSLKREIAMLRRDVAGHVARWDTERRALSEKVETLEAEEETVPLPPVQALATAIAGHGASANLTRRSQALRRWRRGESAEQISAALDMPRAEVELLIKAYRAASPESTTAAVGQA